MIPNEKVRHHLAVKKLSALLKGITLKNDGYSYFLNCLHSFRSDNKLKCHEKVRENKNFCGINFPTQKI